MFIMFGWVKETKEIGAGLACYCFRCQRPRTWARWKQTEWVSFFTIKTIPFLSTSHAVCTGCREAIRLEGKHAKAADDGKHTSHLIDYLEERQLAHKSPVQRSYLLAQRDQTRRDS